MNDINGAELAKQGAEKAEAALKVIRRWLYFLSLAAIIYLQAGFSLRIKDFGNGKSGFVFPNDIAIEGITEWHFRAALLLAITFFLVRFIWFALIFLSGWWVSKSYYQGVAAYDNIFNDDMFEMEQGWIEPEEMPEPEGSFYIVFGLKLKRWFGAIRTINEVILPIGLPLFLGILAFCQLIYSVYWLL